MEDHARLWGRMSMRMSVDEFRRKYPALYNELFGDNKDKGSSISVVFDEGMHDPWRGYLPGPIDYIRRARSLEEALQVIDYLEKHGEITSEEAQEYREKLLNEGIEAFGPQKEDNYYYKMAVEYWRKLSKITTGEQRQQQS